MKKLILFLLLPLLAIAQTTTGQEQEFDYGIKNNSTQTITTPPYLTTTGMDGTQGKIPSALIEKTDNKQNSLAVDGTGTKYPTVDAVNAALPKSYAKVVYVNNSNPNSATIFDLNNPPEVNDNALKADNANLYIGADASTWVYNGSVYATKTVSSETSNFVIQGTGVDAGNSKNAWIVREGPLSVGKNIQVDGNNANIYLNSSSLYGLPWKFTSRDDGYFLIGRSGISNDLYFTDLGQANFSQGVTAPSFIKSGGTSSQFLKADGSIDSTVYAPANSPTLTGTPTAPTAAVGATGNQIATLDYVLNAAATTSFNLINNTPFYSEAGKITNNSTGIGLSLENNSSGKAAYILNQSNGQGLDLLNNNNTGSGIRVTAYQGATGNLYEGIDSGLSIAYKVDYLGNLTSQKIISNNVIRLKNYTVATLPTGVQGDTAFVIDATAPTYLGTLTGGGSVVCPVFYNGTAWVAH